MKKYITLCNILNAIAEAIELEPSLAKKATFENEPFQEKVALFWSKNEHQIEWARRRGIAARWLNEVLQHIEMPLQWLEYSEPDRFYIKNESIKIEAINLLRDITNWGNIFEESFCEYIRNASTGYKSDLLDDDISSKICIKQPDVLRQIKVGFYKDELLSILNKSKIPYNLDSNDEGDEPTNEPEPAVPVSVELGDRSKKPLLKTPAKKDDWFDAINDMTTAYYAEYEAIPNEGQAWAQLSQNPPHGYNIKSVSSDKPKGENSLSMPGISALTRRGFGRRWERYVPDSD
ncbi:hypothetical protein RP726_00840 [Candidatus Methylospira mobilis]|uniref:hypothetical protein n=1 Tax=Candidatus Methylospira mobilis TaxID=1808979 RepID=UPI0028EE395B|nr:hypothetical protein [Candidatus Methylospira mobilis]WNV04975.1 hypothetical protein RP726_00840 [Candidatus Methylospira mobilis]